MAKDPGEWYDARRQEAERLEAELAGAQKALELIRGLTEQLRRAVERARFVGD